MKKIIVQTLSAAILLSSCMSTEVSSKNNFNYSSLKKDEIYYVIKKDKFLLRNLTLTQEDQNHLYFVKESESYKIPKEDILKIKKNRTGKTLLLATGTIGLLILVPAYINNGF